MVVAFISAFFLLSLALLERGVQGFGLDLPNLALYFLASTVAIFFIAWRIKRNIYNVESKFVKTRILIWCLLTSVISAFAYLAVILILNDIQGERSLIIFVGPPIYFLIFLFINTTVSFLGYFYEKNKESVIIQRITQAFFLVILLIFIFAIYKLSLCDFVGCDSQYLSAKALRKNDPLICENAPSGKNTGGSVILTETEGPNHRMKEDCYEALAYATNNPDLCEKADYNNDWCYGNLAKTLLNPSLCDLIKVDYEPFPELQPGYDSSFIQSCYAGVVDVIVEKAQHTEECDIIKKKEARSLCESETNYKLAIQNKNSSLCGSAGEKKNDCYYELAKLISNPGLCELSGENKYVCLNELAEKQKDPSLCENMGVDSSDSKNSCIDNLGEISADPVLCAKIEDRSSRTICFNGMANKMIDPALCNKIWDLEKKAECIYAISKKTNNIELCKKADSHIAWCYAAHAIKLSKPSICDQAGNEALKNKCYSIVAKNSDR